MNPDGKVHADECRATSPLASSRGGLSEQAAGQKCPGCCCLDTCGFMHNQTWNCISLLSVSASPCSALNPSLSPVSILFLCFPSLPCRLAVSSQHLGEVLLLCKPNMSSLPWRTQCAEISCRLLCASQLRILVNCRHRGWHFLPERTLSSP